MPELINKREGSSCGMREKLGKRRITSPEWVGLDPNRLYPSVFAGNEVTPADDEAFEIWNKEIGIFLHIEHW